MIRFVSVLLSALLLSLGCVEPSPSSTNAPQNTVPGSTGKADGAGHVSWGGNEPSAWTPEAILANAAYAATARHAGSGVADVVVSIPVKMLSTSNAPFGDGQTNAGASLASWNATRPPLVATLVSHESGARQLHLVIDREVPTNATSLTLWTTVNTSPQDWSLSGARDASGDLTVVWSVPADVDFGDLLSDHVALVQIDGWDDAFPLRFKHPVHPANALAATHPAGTEMLPDPAKVGAQGAHARLLAGAAGPAYNAHPYEPASVHSQVAGRATAVGGAQVWVADAADGPLKHIYICLDPRDVDAEAATGAPSGSGWHAIGDPAESLTNTLSEGSILTGWAAERPVTADWGLAYGLTDVATFRWLRAGEALVTGKTQNPSPPVFHWFAVRAPVSTCLEIWVHDCAPDADLTLACRNRPVQFIVDGAETAWGEEIRVVGGGDVLGNWNSAHGVPLDAFDYPSWIANVALEPGETVEFKFVRVGPGGVVWEAGGNRVWTVPTSGFPQFRGTFR